MNMKSCITVVKHNCNKMHLNDIMTAVAKRGKDGGCVVNLTNLQVGVPKGGNLSHALHEGVYIDQKRYLRALVNTKNQQQSGTQRMAPTTQ